MDKNDPSYKGQRGYNRFLLAIYDPWVIGFMTRAMASIRREKLDSDSPSARRPAGVSR